jgi:hypothetical protein
MESCDVRSLTVWHGTTRSAAERIARVGFARMETTRMMEDVAREHGVSATGLREVLQEAGRFVLIQVGRDNAAWFASSKEDAASWAHRAPEARWEALWGVWWLTHGGMEANPRPWTDPKAAGWHESQFFSDPPAVVEVRVPVDRLQDRYQEPLSPEEAQQHIEFGVEELSVAAPAPAEWVVGYEVIPRRVSFTAAAGLLGLTTEELTRRVNEGEILGLRRPDRPLDDWYWHLDEFAALAPGLGG